MTIILSGGGGGNAHLGKSNGLGVKRRGARGVGTVRGVAHGGIQRRPYWPEDVARWMQRRLLERAVRGLGDTGCTRLSVGGLDGGVGPGGWTSYG